MCVRNIIHQIYTYLQYQEIYIYIRQIIRCPWNTCPLCYHSKILCVTECSLSKFPAFASQSTQNYHYSKTRLYCCLLCRQHIREGSQDVLVSTKGIMNRVRSVTHILMICLRYLLHNNISKWSIHCNNIIGLGWVIIGRPCTLWLMQCTCSSLCYCPLCYNFPLCYNYRPLCYCYCPLCNYFCPLCYKVFFSHHNYWYRAWLNFVHVYCQVTLDISGSPIENQWGSR